MRGEQDRGVQALRMFGAEMNAMLPALVVGCAVAGFIQVAVSRDLLLTLGAESGVVCARPDGSRVRHRYLLNGRRLLHPLTRITVHPGRAWSPSWCSVR